MKAAGQVRSSGPLPSVDFAAKVSHVGSFMDPVLITF